jgi:hypothetical protein
MYTPECAANGAPCTDDPTSVCVISTEGNYKFCGGACEVDADCRPGWFCKADDFYSGVSACEAIEDCLTYGCNDPEGKLACVPDFFGSKCWLDACKNDPCAGIAHADGTCANMWDTYDCGCVEGYGWNSSAKTCDIST